jgi:hypothetical protein
MARVEIWLTAYWRSDLSVARSLNYPIVVRRLVGAVKSGAKVSAGGGRISNFLWRLSR